MRSSIEEHLGSRQVSRVVYGAIIGLALVVALENHPPAPGVMAGTLLGTAVAVGLAELYSEIVGAETRTRAPVGGPALRELWADTAAVAAGISFPAVFFALAAAGAIEDDSAFDIAQWSGLGLIGFYGFWGARLRGAGLLRSVAHALAIGLIGGFLIGLKALLH